MTVTALPIKQNNAPNASSSKPNNTGKRNSSGRPSIYPLSPPDLSHLENGAGPTGASPMSFGMSFTNAGGLMKSWKQSFMTNNGLALGGMSFGDKGGFGSYRNGTGSFMGYIDDSMDPLDPFLTSTNDHTYSFSFNTKNGSFRSPSALGLPIVLGSFNGGQSYGTGKSFTGASVTGRSFTGSSANWGKVKSNILQKEADYCKNFMCCGKDLGNLHDLLDHYEEAHVVVVDSPSAASLAELPNEMDPDSRWAYGGDDLDVEMEAMDEESPSSSGSETAPNSANTSPIPEHALPGLLPTSSSGSIMTSAMKKLALEDVLKASVTTSNLTSSLSKEMSAFDSVIVSSPPKPFIPDLSLRKPEDRRVHSANLAASRRAMHGGVGNNQRPLQAAPPKNAFGLNVRRSSPEPAKTTMGFSAIAPTALFGAAAPNASATAISGSSAISNSAETPVAADAEDPDMWNNGASSRGQDDPNVQPSLFSTHRPFRCPQPGCQKSYKQANGLKYHMLKGQCNFEVRDAMEWAGLSQEEAEERAKPFACAAGDGCLKRYRQANGLKYHYMNSGLHGEIGLILLAQGQHPMPSVVPKEQPKTRPAHPAANRPGARAAGILPGSWVKNAVKASGKELGLPLTASENPRVRKGEDAVLFSTDEAIVL